MRLLTPAMAQVLHEFRQKLHSGHDRTPRFEDCTDCSHNKTSDGLIVFKGDRS